MEWKFLDTICILILSINLCICSPFEHQRHGRLPHYQQKTQIVMSMRSDSTEDQNCKEQAYSDNPSVPTGTGPTLSQSADNPLNFQLSPENRSKPENPSIFLSQSDEGFALITPEPENRQCPSGSGIYRKTGTCHKFTTHTLSFDEDDVCGTEKLMDFYKSKQNSTYGECDCKTEFLGIQRPIAYWKKTDQCYWLFDQGPCKNKHYWFVLNDNDSPECSPRSCPENSPKDWAPLDNRRKYYFRFRGKCYMSEEIEKEYCGNETQHKIYLGYEKSSNKLVPECKPVSIMETKTLLSGVKPLPCLPGHKESATGECRQTSRFE